MKKIIFLSLFTLPHFFVFGKNCELNKNNSATQLFDIRLNSVISVNPNPIEYYKPFSVSVDLKNFGTGSADNFSGDYAVSMYNSNNLFVDFVEIKTGMTLNFNSSTPLIFTINNQGFFPGQYRVGVFYKQTGTTTWVPVSEMGNYKNYIYVTVKGNT